MHMHALVCTRVYVCQHSSLLHEGMKGGGEVITGELSDCSKQQAAML